MGTLFEGYELRTLIADLRSVKLGPEDRRTVEALGQVPTLNVGQIGEAWALVRRFRRQLVELHAARERARRTRGRQVLGLTSAQVVAAQAARREEEELRRSDLGL